MPTVRLNKGDTAVAEEYGLVFEEPPVNTVTRKSKHSDLYDNAIALCISHPDQWLRLTTYAQPQMPYQLAKAINNDDRKEFVVQDGHFDARSTKIPAHTTDDGDTVADSYGVWIRYVEGPRPAAETKSEA